MKNKKLTYNKCNLIKQKNDKNKIFKELENFKLFEKQNKLKDINYCSNPVYKSIVFLILLGILIYFIWFVIRKQYNDDIDVSDLVSTPFKK